MTALAPSLVLAVCCCASLASASVATAGDRPILQFDFYRAMQGSAIGAYALQNFNLASIAGASKYIHTEVIAEHVMSDPERQERKYGIDTVARLRFKVKNPTALLAPSGKATQVDFGPFVTFDSGVATNLMSHEWIKQWGGFVGVQQQTDVRWPYTEPYFWFSVTGWCPNARYDRIPIARQEAAMEEGSRSRVCEGVTNKTACSTQAAECAFEEEEGTCTARDPAPVCMNLTSTHSGGIGRHVLGGLCPGGEGNLSVDPTGEMGCTYSYDSVSQLSLDKVVGIVDEDCGGRLCTDWLDFRRHCSNPAYKRKFDVATEAAVPFPYCVEYDIHPFCEADCSAARCQQLPESERELGLPFWTGKCSAKANEARTERFGFGLGEKSATANHNLGDTVDHEATCIHENPGLCTPKPGKGGNYCTRQWAGVCFNCWIPGTSRGWPAVHMPYCPYDILQLSDYKGRFPEPDCKSSLPRDLCCLYTGSCTVTALDALGAPLDEDGFTLVASWLNTTAMSTFLRRAAANRSMVIGSHALEDFAYSCWARHPRKGASLKETLEEMLSQGIATLRGTTTSTATSTTFTSTTLTSTQTAVQAVFAVETQTGKGRGPLMWALFGALAVSCLALAAFFTVGKARSWCRRSAEETMILPPAASPAEDLEAPQVLDVNLPRLGLNGRSIRTPTGRGADGFEFQKEKPLDEQAIAPKVVGKIPGHAACMVVPSDPQMSEKSFSGAPPSHTFHRSACEKEDDRLPPSLAAGQLFAAKGASRDVPLSHATAVDVSGRADEVPEQEETSSSFSGQASSQEESIMILDGRCTGTLVGGTEALRLIQMLPEQDDSAEGSSGSPSSGSIAQVFPCRGLVAGLEQCSTPARGAAAALSAKSGRGEQGGAEPTTSNLPSSDKEKPPPIATTWGPPRTTPRSEHSSAGGSSEAAESVSTFTLSGQGAFLPQENLSEEASVDSKESIGYLEI